MNSNAASAAERLGGSGELTSLAWTSDEKAEPENLVEASQLSATTVL